MGSASTLISQMIVDMLLGKLFTVFPLLTSVPLVRAALRNVWMCINARLTRIKLRLMCRDNTCSWRRVKKMPMSVNKCYPSHSSSHCFTLQASLRNRPGAKTIKKNTNSTQNKFQTHRAKQYEVTSFLSTDGELSTETCSKNVYSLGP